MTLPDLRSLDSQREETFLAPSADKKTHNHNKQSLNYHPSLSTLRPRRLSRRKIKYRVISTDVPVNVIDRLPNHWSKDSQGQQTFLAPSPDKQTGDHDIECSYHHPFLSTIRPKRLSRSKIKWWVMYANLIVYVIVRLPNHWSRDSQGQQIFLAPSPDKQTRDHDIECSNHHPFLSTLRPRGLSRRKIKYRVVSTNVPVNVIDRLPNHWSKDSQGQQTFLAPSLDKQTGDHDIECSNHHPFLSTLRPRGLSRRKIKYRVVSTNVPVNVIDRLPNHWSKDSQGQQTFLATSPDKQTRDHDIECSNHHLFLSTLKPKGLSRSNIKW